MASHPPVGTSARTSPLEGMPAPRWDRKAPIYPTQLRHYLECPHRCRLQHIDKVSHFHLT